MLILGLLGMYFDAAVIFVMNSSLLFRLAVAILCFGTKLSNCNSSTEFLFIFSFEYVDSWPNLAFQDPPSVKFHNRTDKHVMSFDLLIKFCFNFQAHICKLDRQAEGTLPPHAFALLMIHFLQRLRVPLLPCIHDFITLGENDSYISK